MLRGLNGLKQGVIIKKKRGLWIIREVRIFLNTSFIDNDKVTSLAVSCSCSGGAGFRSSSSIAFEAGEKEVDENEERCHRVISFCCESKSDTKIRHNPLAKKDKNLDFNTGRLKRSTPSSVFLH
jgi:hypothetical protein